MVRGAWFVVRGLQIVSDSPHRIRLRRPWQSEGRGDRIRWTRRFGRPTGLAPGQRVWLVLEDVPAASAVSLNGHVLPVGERAFDVTALLRARNELVLETQAAGPPADTPPGLVALEIRQASE